MILDFGLVEAVKKCSRMSHFLIEFMNFSVKSHENDAKTTGNPRAGYLLRSNRNYLLPMPQKPLKVGKSIVEQPTVMTVTTKQTSQKPVPYPDKTTGSDAAAQVRKVANKLTETQRAEMFERGMRIIYGGNGNCAAKVRS